MATSLSFSFPSFQSTPPSTITRHPRRVSISCHSSPSNSNNDPIRVAFSGGGTGSNGYPAVDRGGAQNRQPHVPVPLLGHPQQRGKRRNLLRRLRLRLCLFTTPKPSLLPSPSLQVSDPMPLPPPTLPTRRCCRHRRLPLLSPPASLPSSEAPTLSSTNPTLSPASPTLFFPSSLMPSSLLLTPHSIVSRGTSVWCVVTP
ncbi:hypothetical protein glysoja_002599 [Glycine soja]|nr:hypothetical protein glysoja_002599 [Glycine soja]